MPQTARVGADVVVAVVVVVVLHHAAVLPLAVERGDAVGGRRGEDGRERDVAAHRREHLGRRVERAERLA